MAGKSNNKSKKKILQMNKRMIVLMRKIAKTKRMKIKTIVKRINLNKTMNQTMNQNKKHTNKELIFIFNF
jgi:hypothetical protein